MLRTILRTLVGTLVLLIVTLLLVARLAFGFAIWIIAFGAAYIILWELGVF